jgi:hypothetical protein
LTGVAGLFLLADAARLSAADTSPKGGPNPAQTNAVAIVAPIFEHGEGRGADGCVVITPPVFLSEEAALQVIREELAAKGVTLGTNQTAMTGVTVERGILSAPANPSGVTNRTKLAGYTFEIKKEPFKADVADPQKKVFVEFLCERDAWRWDQERGKEEGNLRISTIRSYDLPKTAAYVARRVKQQATDKVYFGTFYDPIAGTMDMQAKSTGQRFDRGIETQRLLRLQEQGAIESRRLLRLQVQDFLKWLQAQGAI